MDVLKFVFCFVGLMFLSVEGLRIDATVQDRDIQVKMLPDKEKEGLFVSDVPMGKIFSAIKLKNDERNEDVVPIDKAEWKIKTAIILRTEEDNNMIISTLNQTRNFPSCNDGDDSCQSICKDTTSYIYGEVTPYDEVVFVHETDVTLTKGKFVDVILEEARIKAGLGKHMPVCGPAILMLIADPMDDFLSVNEPGSKCKRMAFKRVNIDCDDMFEVEDSCDNVHPVARVAAIAADAAIPAVGTCVHKQECSDTTRCPSNKCCVAAPCGGMECVDKNKVSKISPEFNYFRDPLNPSQAFIRFCEAGEMCKFFGITKKYGEIYWTIKNHRNMFWEKILSQVGIYTKSKTLRNQVCSDHEKSVVIEEDDDQDFKEKTSTITVDKSDRINQSELAQCKAAILPMIAVATTKDIEARSTELCQKIMKRKNIKKECPEDIEFYDDDDKSTEDYYVSLLKGYQEYSAINNYERQRMCTMKHDDEDDDLQFDEENCFERKLVKLIKNNEAIKTKSFPKVKAFIDAKAISMKRNMTALKTKAEKPLTNTDDVVSLMNGLNNFEHKNRSETEVTADMDSIKKSFAYLCMDKRPARLEAKARAPMYLRARGNRILIGLPNYKNGQGKICWKTIGVMKCKHCDGHYREPIYNQESPKTPVDPVDGWTNPITPANIASNVASNSASNGSNEATRFTSKPKNNKGQSKPGLTKS